MKLQCTASQDSLMEKALAAGIRIYSIHEHYLIPQNIPVNTFLLGYASLSAPEIETAIQKLKDAWHPYLGDRLA